ncbi:helix-turn-helix domain-containing protein [Lentzea indica]|uniref:helix-turn-helix domain-containing protein n=1 Tax=Lentzea indica TaxID=2604800 RepID=UPI00143B8B9E|nr:helix-turn-helix transcriptional regulator [Lentzea indica]
MSPTFAQELRRLRNERGLSLSQMAGLVPYSKGHLSKIENGQVHPNPEMAKIFDDALQAEGHLAELADAPVRPIPSDHTTLRTYDSMFDHHRALGHRLSPEVVLASLRPQVDVLSSMARSASDPGLGRGLWLLAPGTPSTRAGWSRNAATTPPPPN